MPTGTDTTTEETTTKIVTHVKSMMSRRPTSVAEAMPRKVSRSRFGPPKPSSPPIEAVAAGPTSCRPARIAVERLPRSPVRGGARRTRTPTTSSAMPGGA